MKEINVYEIPVLELLEAILAKYVNIDPAIRKQIVLDFGKALVKAHELLKEQAHEDTTQLS